MQAKFAFISNENCRQDFMFILNIASCDEVQLIEDDLNKNLTTGYVRFIDFINERRGKHEVSRR